MHVHSTPPGTGAWQAATPSRAGSGATASSGSASIDDFAGALPGTSSTAPPGISSAASPASGGGSMSVSTLSSSLQSMLTSLQASRSMTQEAGTGLMPQAAGPGSTPRATEGRATPADGASSLSAMLGGYQLRGYQLGSAAPASDADSATDLSV